MSRFRNILKNLSLILKIAWEEDKVLFAGYIFTSFLSVILLFLVYFLYKLMIDQVFAGIETSPSSTFFLIIVGYLLVEYLSRFVTSTLNAFYFEFLLRAKFQNILARKFMEKLAALDFANLEDGKIRNLIAKVSDTFTWRIHANLQMVNYIVYNLAAILISFIVAYRFGYGYFIVLFIFAAPLYFIRAKYGNIQWSIYSSQSNKINYLWYLRYLFTEFPTLSEIKIYGLKDHFLDKAKIIQNEIVDKYKKPIIKQTLISSAVSIILPIIIFFSVRDFATGIFGNKHSVGDFTFFLNTLYTFVGQISSLLVNMGVVYENNLYVEDYFKLQDIDNKISDIRSSYKNIKDPGRIVFDNVSFKYPGSNDYALKNISLTIKKGEDVAIVGHNGAGKTTLIKLLFRFHDPTSGNILVDGKNLKKLSLNEWYKKLSVLFQDFAKYNLSISENIKLGDVTKNKSVEKFINQVRGEELLRGKKGVEQILGSWFEDGEEISVGQWQKIAIARALYRNAPILILDEPTSNIDPQAEYEIFNNLKSVYKNKNLIFISHRFSTVRMADRIYVLDRGSLIEQGSHKELLSEKGTYYKYFNIQKKGYD